MIKVLYVASEAVPFIKSGGLADVAFSLPRELRNLGIDIRVIIPKYQGISEKFKNDMKACTSYTVELAWRKLDCKIDFLEYKGIPFYFIDNKHYFERNDLYGFDDDCERFSFFCKAVIDLIDHINFIPDIIHCNDWHCGMICPMLNEFIRMKPKLSEIKTIYTIHNLRYKGIFPKEILEDILGFDMQYFHEDDFNFYGNISFMKAGINYADLITTVSKTYAKEIQTKFYGEGLDDLLRSKNDKLKGIINGIDNEIYNPRKDNYIFLRYDLGTLRNKKKNKIKLQKELKLKINPYIPMIGVVTRLANMKGINLLVEILDDLLLEDLQMVVLGTGDENLELQLKCFEKKYPNKLSVNILFDEPFAHRIYAGADMFLMPSLFEPCGLSQLIAMRYGTIPIVRDTGGLKDTVKAFDGLTKKGNGFSFPGLDANHLLCSIKSALKCYKDKSIWKKIIRNAMKGDYSWKNSALEYKDIYEEIINS